MMLPNDGVTTDRPIEVMSRRKKDNEFLAAFSAATTERTRVSVSSHHWSGNCDAPTNKNAIEPEPPPFLLMYR